MRIEMWLLLALRNRGKEEYMKRGNEGEREKRKIGKEDKMKRGKSFNSFKYT